MKDKIAEAIAYLLPDRVIIWVIIRAFSYTSTRDCANKEINMISYFDIYDSWKKKMDKKI